MARRRIGRQKVEIRPIKKLESRRVCFSKRRAGLFKKASELAILCGVQLAVVSFSPARKAFSFGHPSVEAVLQRFANTGQGAGVGGGGGAGADNGRLAELNRQYMELRAIIDTEKARKERVDADMAKEVAEAANPVVGMLPADVRDLEEEEELMAYEAALAKMLAAMAARRNQDALNHSRAMMSSMPPPPGFAAAGRQMLPPPPGFPAMGMQMMPPPAFGGLPAPY